ncbi:MAG TPA: PilZ domain-containing protein [Bryobacteraceae bacterium]|nr:PilZ domain-containing protein [Bryobacteraceae bacterium]
MSEQRKNQRFELKLPIELLRAGNDTVPQIGETRNLSSGGVLFTSNGKLQKGDPIEYLVTLPSAGDDAGLRLRCMGKVVRVDERETPEAGASRFPFAIAATLERHEFLRR